MPLADIPLRPRPTVHRPPPSPSPDQSTLRDLFRDENLPPLALLTPRSLAHPRSPSTPLQPSTPRRIKSKKSLGSIAKRLRASFSGPSKSASDHTSTPPPPVPTLPPLYLQPTQPFAQPRLSPPLLSLDPCPSFSPSSFFRGCDALSHAENPKPLLLPPSPDLFDGPLVEKPFFSTDAVDVRLNAVFAPPVSSPPPFPGPPDAPLPPPPASTPLIPALAGLRTIPTIPSLALRPPTSAALRVPAPHAHSPPASLHASPELASPHP
ncbi:hypothetical protein K488DRAFT_92518, partial [Vararia minispora EC-137]